MKNIEKYQQIFLVQFPISVSDLNEEYTRESEDLWDDFASLAMCLAMDVEFGVHISDEDEREAIKESFYSRKSISIKMIFTL